MIYKYNTFYLLIDSGFFLTEAGMYIRNEEMCNDFFDQSIIRRQKSEDVEEEVTEPTP